MKANPRYALSILLFLLAAHARISFAAQHADAVLQADQSLIAALNSSDSKSAAKLLDADFSWTDEQGLTRDKQATLNEFTAFAAENKSDSVDSHFCGQLGFVYGTHHGARFVRIWVKRQKGWQLFVNLDSTAATDPLLRTPGAAVGSANDCDGRCRELQFKSLSPVKHIVAEVREMTNHDRNDGAEQVANRSARG